ncbi:MAG: autotransporter domain-containing protein [Xanthomonadaceae bacterium]|nr:autotransporter domain-containing protein [Xanthomonadaceae bacterium]
MNWIKAPISLAVTSLVFAMPASAQSFVPLWLTDLPPPNGTFYSKPWGISGNGRVVVGESNLSAMVWRDGSSTPTALAMPAQTIVSAAYAASADGSVIVGSYSLPQSNPSRFGPNPIAYRWTQATGVVGIAPAATTSSTATGVSRDGSVVVGSAFVTALNALAPFRWTQTGGSVLLGLMPGSNMSVATGVSGDGSIVVGWGSFGLQGVSQAYRWTESLGFVGLGLPTGATAARAQAISDDGGTIVGGVDGRAARWRPANGWVLLDLLPGHTQSTANAVSADGSVVVGGSYNATESRAVRWTGTQAQTIEQWLAASGYTQTIGVGLVAATGVSADGSVVVGYSEDNRGWLARSGSGILVDVDAFNAGLSESAAGLALGVRDQTRFALRDAQSHAIDYGDAARPCAWLSTRAGDLHGGQRVAQTQVGACANVGDAHIAFGVGGTRTRQDGLLGGRTDLDGRFANASVSFPIASSLRGNVSVSRGWFDGALRRRYVNGSAIDMSQARPDARTSAVDARVDWRIATNAESLTWTPYLAYTWMRTDVDPYTETGGGFPAAYDRLTDDTQHARLGVSAERAWRRMSLQLTLEAVHRMDEGPTATRGHVVGLYDFAAPIDSAERTWGGINLSAQIPIGERGILGLDAQGASAGDDAQWSVGASYRLRF